MNDRFHYETRDAIHTVSVPCDLTISDCEQQASRLRSWALIRGEPVTGLPYLRLCGAMRGEVHLPTAGEYTPHPEVGVQAADSPAGPVAVVNEVRFAQLRETVDEIEGPIATGPGSAGAAEFHPVGQDAWGTGTLIWPVQDVPCAQRPPAMSSAAS